MTGKFLNQNKSINISEDSPLYKEMRKPQLMLIRHMGFSSFFKNKKTNAIIQDNWRKLNPHRVSRPKAREQYLSSEMTKDEYLRQEREKNQKNQNKK